MPRLRAGVERIDARVDDSIEGHGAGARCNHADEYPGDDGDGRQALGGGQHGGQGERQREYGMAESHQFQIVAQAFNHNHSIAFTGFDSVTGRDRIDFAPAPANQGFGLNAQVLKDALGHEIGQLPQGGWTMIKAWRCG